MLTLDNLPLEVLETICEHVSGSRSSLLALSQVNKCCLDASLVSRHRDITFQILDLENLRQITDRFEAALDRRASWERVRSVRIEWNKKNKQQDRLEEMSHSKTLWQPLSELLERIPALTDVTFRSLQQFPPCLLQTLHQHHPSCRLHLSNFRLYSLGDASLNLHERELVSSPCLFDVALQCNYKGGSKSWIYTDEGRGLRALHNAEEDLQIYALLRMVASSAPNLSRVRLLVDTDKLQPALSKAIEAPAYEFPPLHPSVSAVSRPNKLSPLMTLELGMVHTLVQGDLALWNTYTRLSALRVLKLEDVETAALTWATAHCSFDMLEALVLHLDYNEVEDFGSLAHPRLIDPEVKARHEVSDFLRSLPPLKTLELCGGVSSDNLEACIRRHAVSLRSLSIGKKFHEEAFFSSSFDVFRECPAPFLQTLSLPIKRSKGNEDEVGIYKALGALPRLQELSLVLDCTDYSVCYGAAENVEPGEMEDSGDPGYFAIEDPSFDDFHQQIFQLGPMLYKRQPRYGRIRDAFINSAVDEKLARTIFDTVSSAKPSRSFPLERLILRPTGGCEFGDKSALGKSTAIVRHISRSWLLDRTPFVFSKLIATEIDQDRRKLPRPPSKLDSQSEAIFGRLWPTTSPEGDWRENWHSFPLTLVGIPVQRG